MHYKTCRIGNARPGFGTKAPVIQALWPVFRARSAQISEQTTNLIS
jgi:hypothetical protein